MNNIIYLKKVDNFEEILNTKYKRMPQFFKKCIYKYKNIFNIITKKNIEDNNLWILPIKDKYSSNQIERLIKKISKHDNTYIFSNDLKNTQLYKLINKCNISYIKGNILKKYLIIKVLEYINNIQNKDISNMEVTILIKDISKFNIYFIEKLSKLVKNIKIVTPNIYKFKKIEDILYNEYGIAIQFSNSYKKSLSKSKIIVNLEYSDIDINEYVILNKAIIINSTDDNIKIKSKLFNGIVINSLDIKFKIELREKFKKINIYNKYNTLELYESFVYNEKEINDIFKRIDNDKVSVLSLIGNNGNINKKEFKNIFKMLDK